MEPILGMIMTVGFNFVPRGWAYCQGQSMPISENQSLFSLLGTAFGGDGRTSFALPDLAGRSIVGAGTGQGLNPVQFAQLGGTETINIAIDNMPSHNHTASLHGETAVASSQNPEGNLLAAGMLYAPAVPAENKTLSDESIVVDNIGGSLALQHRDPFLCLNYIIALEGIYPSRN